MSGFGNNSSNKCYLCGAEVSTKMEMSAAQESTDVECRDCGNYTISWDAIDAAPRAQDETRWKLRIAVRAASDHRRPIKLTQDSFDNPPFYALPGTPLDGHDEVLAALAKQIKAYGHRGNINLRNYSQFRFRDQSAFGGALSMMVEMGLIDKADGNNGAVDTALTLDGWRRAKEIQQGRGEGKKAFVAMNFETSFNSLYDDAIRPALETVGYTPTRVDRERYLGSITDRIVAELRSSAIVVADFTGHKRGVYFEAGFAEGLGRPVIYTCSESDINNAHFDTRQTNHITWRDHEQFREALIDRIRALGLTLKN